MYVTACLAGQDDVDVEVGEDCRTLQALKEAIVKELPQLCVEDFDVSVGGRALDDDEGVVSLVDSVTLDVVPNTRGLSALALREAGLEVSEAGLLEAAGDDDMSVFRLYLDAGVPLDCVDSRGRTPVHHAVVFDCLGICRLLLDRGQAVQCVDNSGWMPLHYAARNNNEEMCELLLDRGHDLLCVDDCKNTPLHVAAQFSSEATCKFLLDRGHAPLVEDYLGWTPHMWAKYNNCQGVCGLLQRRGGVAATAPESESVEPHPDPQRDSERAAKRAAKRAVCQERVAPPSRYFPKFVVFVRFFKKALPLIVTLAMLLVVIGVL